MNLTNVGTNVYLSFVRVVFIREMRNVKAEFIIFVFFLSILLFLLLNDFEIRASGNIFERFSGERYDQTSKRNETSNFKIETYPARDPPTVSLVRYGPRFLIFFWSVDPYIQHWNQIIMNAKLNRNESFL